MKHLSRGFSLRYLNRHPWQTVLSVLGVALGVAVVVAVDLANQSARRGLAMSVQAMSGETTHRIVGGPSGFDEALYRRLRLEEGVRPSAPVVEGYVSVEGETWRLLGLDPFAEKGLRHLVSNLGYEALRDLLSRPDAVLLAGVTARRLGLAPGSMLTVKVSGSPRRTTLVGLVEAHRGPEAAFEGLLISDISTAQEILDRAGRLDRIDLAIDQPDAVARLAARLPPGVQLQNAEDQNTHLEELSEAFQLNLTAMSLLALVVGMFLIYNSMSFSVIRRRQLIGTLRTIGASRFGIFGLILMEAGGLGLVGTLFGLLFGGALAHGLLHLVTRTINDLYFVLNVRELTLFPASLLKSVVLGVGASLAAAVIPALEAALTSPVAAQRRSLIESRAHRLIHPMALCGALLIALGLALPTLGGRSLLAGFGYLLLVIVGFTLVAPLAVYWMGKGTGWLTARLFGARGSLIVRGIDANLSRTGVAVTALAVAIAATVGVGVMITSFRATVDAWLSQTLRSDIYITAPNRVSSRATTPIDPGVADRMAQLPQVGEVSTGRRLSVSAASGETTQLFVLRPAAGSGKGFKLAGEGSASAWEGFREGRGVLISEPLAYRRNLTVGDQIHLLTDKGEKGFKILGVFHDYSTDQGMVTISRELYEAYWDDRRISSIGLYLRDKEDGAAVIRAVATALSDRGQSLLVRSNQEIKSQSLAIFDRTFAVTGVLRLVAMAVAFVGVLSALLIVQLERAKEIAVLRATGFTPRQVWGMVSAQSALMGMFAGLLALPLGILLAVQLIDVINLRAFGWTMQTLLPAGVLAEALLLSVGAALLAALIPAARMAGATPAESLREE